MTQGRTFRTSDRVLLAEGHGGGEASPLPPANFFRQPLAPILTAVGVTILVVLAVTFARATGQIAVLWGANGLAACVWLRAGRGTAFDLGFGALVLVGILAGELMVGHGPLTALAYSFCNLVEIVAAVLLARKFLPGLNVRSVQGAVRFMGISILASLAGAVIAALGSGNLLPQSATQVMTHWWSGHALGLALIGIFGLALERRHIANLLKPVRLAEALALLALIGGAGLVIFGKLSPPYSFLLMPPLVVMAVRFRVVGSAAALIIITVVAMMGTMAGSGPYQSLSADLRPMMVHLLVLFGYMPILLVAALLEERDRLHAHARQDRDRAEMASAAKSRLLANVAHEIKSPVSGIIGIGELWATGQLGTVTPSQIEMAEMLVKTARQTEALAHDLLDVARAESGAIKVDMRPTDVTGVMDDVRRTMQLRAETARVPVEIVLEGDSFVAQADSHRLSQVIGNLVNNAIKYGGEGGPVKLCALWNNGCVRIEVRDRGPGLSPEKQAQLFEPFNRLGLERSSIEGHGIGLALAKRLTELQGGEIGVISRLGHGTTFWIELRAA